MSDCGGVGVRMSCKTSCQRSVCVCACDYLCIRGGVSRDVGGCLSVFGGCVSSMSLNLLEVRGREDVRTSGDWAGGRAGDELEKGRVAISRPVLSERTAPCEIQ